MFYRTLLTIAALGVTVDAFPQVARKYSNEFLSIGIGARALGMANATVASVSNVTAAYWNPAGLAGVDQDMQIAAMHAEYFAGIAKFDYAGIAVPLPQVNATKRFVAFTIIRFGVDDIPYTLSLVEPDGSINYDNVSTFSAADYAFYFSYGQDMPVGNLENLKFGASTKIVHRRAGDFASSWGFGLDAAFQAELESWRIGLLAKDITTTFNAWSFNFTEEEKTVFQATGNEVPENSLEITLPKIILGGGYAYEFENKLGILSELNLDLTTDGKRNVLIPAKPFSIDPHAGLELSYDRTIFLRAGLGNFQKALDDIDGSQKIITAQPNIGAGLKLGEFTIDYALTDIGNVSQALYSHIFSLMMNFDKTRSKIRRR